MEGREWAVYLLRGMATRFGNQVIYSSRHAPAPTLKQALAPEPWQFDRSDKFIKNRDHFALPPGDFEDGAGIIGKVLLLPHRNRLDTAVDAGSHPPQQADIRFLELLVRLINLWSETP